MGRNPWWWAPTQPRADQALSAAHPGATPSTGTTDDGIITRQPSTGLARSGFARASHPRRQAGVLGEDAAL